MGTAIRHGCKSVVQLEMMPKPPTERREDNQWPQWPKVLKVDYGQEEAMDQFGADPRIYQTTVKAILTDESGQIRALQTVKLEPSLDEKTGRTVMKEVAGSEAEMECDLLLSAAGVFAAGDARRGQSLVVWTIAEGRACAKAVDEYLMDYTNLL